MSEQSATDDLAAMRRQLHAIWLRQFWMIASLVVIAALLAAIAFGAVAIEVKPEGS
jgi:uncharacterized membrane protein